MFRIPKMCLYINNSTSCYVGVRYLYIFLRLASLGGGPIYTEIVYRVGVCSLYTLAVFLCTCIRLSTVLQSSLSTESFWPPTSSSCYSSYTSCTPLHTTTTHAWSRWQGWCVLPTAGKLTSTSVGLRSLMVYWRPASRGEKV